MSTDVMSAPVYHDGPVKAAVIATMFWGIAGFLAGLLAAIQLTWPEANFDMPWTSFGRIRPLHTSAVIFSLTSLNYCLVL